MIWFVQNSPLTWGKIDRKNNDSTKKKWDSCALEAILSEAGGACTTMSGDAIVYNDDFNNSNGFIASANTALHSQLLNKLNLWLTPISGCRNQFLPVVKRNYFALVMCFFATANFTVVLIKLWIFSVWTKSEKNFRMFYYVGLIFALYAAQTIIKQLFIIFEMAFNPAPFDMKNYKAEWALITGCTDGIGWGLSISKF